MSISGGYKCCNINCNSCIGKSLCGEPGEIALHCIDRKPPLKIVGKRKGKRQTNEERLKQMGTKDLAHELALIADWDREQLQEAKKYFGLDSFMEEWLRKPANEE